MLLANRQLAILVLTVGVLAMTGTSAASVTPWAGPVLPADLPREAEPERTLRLAREAAAADRHLEAIQLFQKAIRLDPELRSAVSVELGHQYTWSDEPDSAVAAYRYHLAHFPENMEAWLGLGRALSWADRHDEAVECYQSILSRSGRYRNDVLIGLARVKSWQDDLSEAARLYQEVLASEPDRTEAKLGLAQVLNWSGKHRQAADIYENTLEQNPGNTEAVKGLAYAHYWQGRPDLAMTTLENSATDDAYYKMARSFQNVWEVQASTKFSYRDNTTDGDYLAWRTEVGSSPGYLVQTTVAYTKGRLDDSGLPLIDRDELNLYLYKRFNTSFKGALAPGYQWNRFRSEPQASTATSDGDFDLFVWDAYATITPRDWVRLDVGNERQTVQVPEALLNEIYVTTTTAGLDWRLHHRLLTTWSAQYSNYSDGNGRFGLLERVTWKTPFRLNIGRKNDFLLLQGIEYSNWEKRLNSGYFNPPSLLYLYGGARFVGRVHERVSLDVAMQFGGEKEAESEWVTVGSFEGEVGFKLADNLNTRLGYVRSGSRLISPDGFRSNRFFVALDFTF